MAKTKRKYVRKTKKPKKLKKPIAQYIGGVEVMITQFKKIINKGDLVPEFPIEEARARRDFIVINEEED